jgi:hypothetical protein
MAASLISLLLYFFLLGAKQESAHQPGDRTAKVSGHVLYKEGTPVKDAEVKIYFFAAQGAILPETRTDEKGSFSLNIPPWGEGVISGMKVGEGYPDAALALYGKGGYGSTKPINSTEGMSPAEVELRFSEPDAVIEWVIQSADKHDPVKNARYSIAWSDDPKILYSTSISEDSRFGFVLPKHPVSIKITAPGFKDWSSADDPSLGPAVLLKPGRHQQRVIFLQRSGSLPIQ